MIYSDRFLEKLVQKVEKLDFVKEFNATLKDKEFLLVADYKGLSVSEISDLRNKSNPPILFLK